jgi:hypothetical protein
MRGSCVPSRVATFEEHNTSGAVVLFDRPSSFLAAREPLGLAQIGAGLDAKIDAVMQRIKSAGR